MKRKQKYNGRKIVYGPKSLGKIQNPGKWCYMELATEFVEEINSKKDRNVKSIVKKAMIRCGMSLNYSGFWEIEQLFKHLHEIIRAERLLKNMESRHYKNPS